MIVLWAAAIVAAGLLTAALVVQVVSGAVGERATTSAAPAAGDLVRRRADINLLDADDFGFRDWIELT